MATSHAPTLARKRTRQGTVQSKRSRHLKSTGGLALRFSRLLVAGRARHGTINILGIVMAVPCAIGRVSVRYPRAAELRGGTIYAPRMMTSARRELWSSGGLGRARTSK